jgi:hypothetical protein
VAGAAEFACAKLFQGMHGIVSINIRACGGSLRALPPDHKGGAL